VFKSLRSTGLALLTASTLAVASAQTLTPPQLLPYTVKVVAGGGASTPSAAGATCPVSGFKTTDAYGDGCLATEVLLGTAAATPGPRDAIADAAGNIFFGDYVNGIIHRIDAITGVLSAVAGGAASSPTTGTTGASCGGTSTDAKGDGCLSTLVKLSHPTGLTFSPAGDLYFADYGTGQIRKVAATAGSIPPGGGIITLVAGSPSGTYGFTVSTNTTPIVAATQSLLDGPYSVAFDTAGDLLAVDEYEAAAVAVNLNTTGTTNPGGTPVPAGQIWKIAGTLTGSAGGYCNTGSGCTYNHTYTDGGPANLSYLRNAYGITADPAGNVYITNEYYDTIQKVAAGTGILTTFAGMNNTAGHALTRGQAGTVAIGSPFGVTADNLGNIYFTDAADGTVWRVDGATGAQFLIASGFGQSGSGFASTTLPGPGIFGISVDPYADLFFGDTEKNTVTEIASGTQFGPVGANQPTNLIQIHFAKGDSPAANAYTITAGANNFTIPASPAPALTSNSDGTTDVVIPITATPSVLGLFTGQLTVKSVLGASANFYLSGTFVQSPITRTAVSYTAGVACTGTTSYSTSTPIKITATLAANGPAAPGGSYNFYANGNLITGSPVNVTNIGTTANPVYGAVLTTTFPTPATYTLTAVYSGDTYFKTSTGTASQTVTSVTPAYSVTAIPNTQGGIVAAGQTALYSFNVGFTSYSGSLSFACSNLPANSSCAFSPSGATSATGAISNAGCSTSTPYVVAMSIFTQKHSATGASIAAGTGRWQLFSIAAGLSLALLIGLRRRRIPFAQVWMSLALLIAASGTLACSSNTKLQPGTPTGPYTVTVTVTPTTGTPTIIPVSLTVQ
jgi:hypothetical protein